MEWINVNEKLPNDEVIAIGYLTVEKEDGTRKVLLAEDQEIIRYSDDLKNHVIDSLRKGYIESFEYLNNDDIYISASGLDEEHEDLIPDKGFYFWNTYNEGGDCEYSEIVFIDEKVIAWMKPYVPDPYMD